MLARLNEAEALGPPAAIVQAFPSQHAGSGIADTLRG